MQKKSLFLFNPFSPSHDNKKNESWSFWEIIMEEQGLIPFILETKNNNNPKENIKILWTGKENKSDLEKLITLFEQKGNNIREKINKNLKERKGALHIIIALVNIPQFLPLIINHYRDIPIFLHLSIGSRSYEELLRDTKTLQNFLQKNKNLTLASLAGSEIIFNQTERRETQKAYDEIVFNQTQTSFSLDDYLSKQSENEIPPAQIAPVSFVEAETLEDDDTMLVLETDAEAIQFMTKAFEVSKKEEKKSEFSHFNPTFITKRLNNLQLIVPKLPYPEYENDTLIKQEKNETLAKKLSQNELRQLHLGDDLHFTLITKYLNDENEIIYDGQRNLICKPLISEQKEILQTANETLVNTFEEIIKNFEIAFLAAEFLAEEAELFEKRIQLAKKEEHWILILDLPNQKGRHSQNLENIKGKTSLKELYTYFLS